VNNRGVLAVRVPSDSAEPGDITASQVFQGDTADRVSVVARVASSPATFSVPPLATLRTRVSTVSAAE
jgi:hypothetical protein